MSNRMRIEKNIEQDVNTNLYYIFVSAGTDENGNRVRYKKTVETLEEARIVRDEFLLKKAKKKRIKAKVTVASRDTLNEYLDYYIDYITNVKKLKGTTVYSDKGKINNHIRPILGNIRLNQLSVQDINKLVVNLREKDVKSGKLSDATIKKVINVLNTVLERAWKEKKIEENPMLYFEKDTVRVRRKREVEIFTEEELNEIIEKVKGHTLELPVYFALGLGIRRGEFNALTWSDIDLVNKTVSINKSRTQVGSEVVVTDTKTEGSVRQLALPDILVEMLQKEKDKQEKDKQDFGEAWGKSNKKDGTNNEGYIFCKANGELYRPNYLSNYFKKFLHNNNIRELKWHSLRHTFASVAIQRTDSKLFEVSKALGHKNINTTTGIYAHLIDKTNSKTINAVANAILNNK